jgi:hypothetical protein
VLGRGWRFHSRHGVDAMMSYSPFTVPIPDKMKDLPVDDRGYPIPWTVLRGPSDGKPHFAINVEELRLKSIRERLCPICGVRLYRGFWFVGGPGSALHPHGAYIDPPLHKECAEYALKVCPYLAAPRYSGRVDDRTLKAADRARIPILIDRTMYPERPPLFVCGMTIGMTVTESLYLVPKRPWRVLEYWRGGEMLDPIEGRREAEQQLEAIERERQS